MNKISGECTEFKDRRKQCTAEEKGKKYLLENKSLSEIEKIRIDGCLKVVGRALCDYLIRIDNNLVKRSVFIELKGSDMAKALDQLCSTILLLKDDVAGQRIDARIVAKRGVPDLVNTPHHRRLSRVVLPTSGNIKHSTNGFYSETV